MEPAELAEPLLEIDEGIPSLEVAQEKATVLPVLLAVGVVLLGPFSFGYCMGYTSPTLASITMEIGLTTSAASFYAALVNLGAMVGAVSGGQLADSLGRKWALGIASVCHLAGWIINSRFSTILWLDTGRFLVGIGTGIVSFACPVYIAETAPVHIRGALGACNQLAVTLGILSVYVVGIFVPWRNLALIGGIPPLLLLLGLLVIPETPRWLGMNGTSEQVADSLRKLRGRKSDISAEQAAISEALEQSQAISSKSGSSFKELFKPKLRLPLIVGIGLMILQQSSGSNSVTFYTGTIFRAAGFDTWANSAGCIIMATQVAMTGVAASLMDKAGRRVLLLVSSSGMGVASFVLGLSFYFQTLSVDSEWYKYVGPLALGGLLVYVAAFSLGMGAVPWLIMSEIFPANVRGTAGSLAVVVNWGFSFLVTETFSYLLEWSHPGAFWTYAVICALGFVFILALVPETKGKTLEEIEASF